jgi:hypothetical protein
MSIVQTKLVGRTKSSYAALVEYSGTYRNSNLQISSDLMVGKHLANMLRVKGKGSLCGSVRNKYPHLLYLKCVVDIGMRSHLSQDYLFKQICLTLLAIAS